MISVSITIQNRAEFEAKLRKLGIELMDFTKELQHAGTDLATYFSTVPFATQGNAYGGRWASVQPKTLEYKVKHYPAHAHDILQRTGHMANSFGFTATRNFLRVWNNTSYFSVHQLGLGNMPRRTMMAINETNKRLIIRDIEEGIQEKINRVK